MGNGRFLWRFALTSDEARTMANIVAFILVVVWVGAIMFARMEGQKPAEEESKVSQPVGQASLPVLSDKMPDTPEYDFLDKNNGSEGLVEPHQKSPLAPLFQRGDEEVVRQRGELENPCVRATRRVARTFTLVAVGDIMLDRKVGGKVKDLGADFPFEGVAELLREADLTFGNLESPISSLGTAAKGKEVTFRAGLESISGVRNAGMDVLSLANNHAMDYGPAALMETMDVLAHSGVVYIGAGANSAAARRPASFTIKGVKVSLLAYCNRFHMVVEAQKEYPGVAIACAEEVKADIQKAKGWADVVIVSFHWGWEYSDHPDAETKALAHLAVESGASLVIGHHPHVIQGVEVYKGGLICYSLGNFIFDQRGTRTKRGLALRCTIGRSGVQQAELLPVTIDAAEFRPYLASGEVAKSILLELKRLSKQLNTELELKENIAVIDSATEFGREDAERISGVP